MYAHDVLVFVLFLADVAHVRPVVGVGAKMLLQHALVDKFLVAQVAREGPLVFVATHVCVIIWLDRKSLGAQLADVLPQTGVGVDDQFVRAQVFVRVEALGTVLALVFSFVQVGLLVYCQVTFRDVTLAAIGANVGATAVVVLQVLQQVGRTRESVVANVTNERFDSFRFGMMYLHWVRYELGAAQKRQVTVLTRELRWLLRFTFRYWAAIVFGRKWTWRHCFLTPQIFRVQTFFSKQVHQIEVSIARPTNHIILLPVLKLQSYPQFNKTILITISGTQDRNLHTTDRLLLSISVICRKSASFCRHTVQFLTTFSINWIL
jgi:hypothetical protein